MIKEYVDHSIRTLILSNEFLSVKILAGKGGDINQITYLPGQMDLLDVEEQNFSAYKNRDLSVKGLSHYSEDSTGGWQDVVPGFGRYGNLVLQDYPVGIAATVPWEIHGETAGQDVVILSVHLPQFPLFLEKKIRLEGEKLLVEESIHNEGDEAADFTWTQHSVFGGSFLDEQVEITYPGKDIFLSSLYARHGGKKQEYTKSIFKVPMPDGTFYNLTKMREPGDDGQLIFTMKAGRGDVSLFHKQKKIGFRLDWEKEVFPYIRCWYRNTKEGYSFAIEPCNYAYSSFEDTDKEKMYLHLDPGEQVKTKLCLSMLHEAQATTIQEENI